MASRDADIEAAVRSIGGWTEKTQTAKDEGLIVFGYDDTADRLGILDFERRGLDKTELTYSRDRAAGFLKGILVASHELLTEVYDADNESGIQSSSFNKLAKFIANFMYIPEDGSVSKEEKKEGYKFKSEAIIYAPDSFIHRAGVNPADLGPETSADIIFEITDRTGKVLVIDLFPEEYVDYGKRHQQYRGVDPNVARRSLSMLKSAEYASAAVARAERTRRAASLSIALYDGGKLISGMKGGLSRGVVEREGKAEQVIGFKLHPYFTERDVKSSTSVFMSLGVPRPDKMYRLVKDLSGLTFSEGKPMKKGK